MGEEGQWEGGQWTYKMEEGGSGLIRWGEGGQWTYKSSGLN